MSIERPSMLMVWKSITTKEIFYAIADRCMDYVNACNANVSCNVMDSDGRTFTRATIGQLKQIASFQGYRASSKAIKT